MAGPATLNTLARLTPHPPSRDPGADARRGPSLCSGRVDARRAEVFAGRLRTFDPEGVVAMFGERKRAAFALLDALDETLADGRETLVPGGYGPADVVWTVFLARMGFVRFDDEVARRPRLARYTRAVKARPSFRAADVWDHLSPLKILKQVL